MYIIINLSNKFTKKKNVILRSMYESLLLIFSRKRALAWVRARANLIPTNP